MVGNHLLEVYENLFVLLALFSEGVTSRLPQESNGYIVHFLLVEHSEGVRLSGALGRAVSDEKGTILVDFV